MSITEADHLQEWFSSAATRGERVKYIIGSLWELTQVQHYSLASIDNYVKCEKWGTHKAIFSLLRTL